MRQRYVTVGSGPAAVSAVETIRAQDPNGEIVIVGAEPYGYYSRPGLAYYLAGEVPENRLFPFRPEDFARLNCQLILGRATGLDAAGHRVTLDDGRILSYDRHGAHVCRVGPRGSGCAHGTCRQAACRGAPVERMWLSWGYGHYLRRWQPGEITFSDRPFVGPWRCQSFADCRSLPMVLVSSSGPVTDPHCYLGPLTGPFYFWG